MLEYRLIRSDRKTLSLELREDGLLVRAPKRASKAAIDAFVLSHRDWIEKKRRLLAERKKAADAVTPLTEAELRALAEEAKRVLPERVQLYAKRLGVTYGRITIRAQKTRWGSCSSKGNLNFNCLLMLTPIEAIDSVVAHELCHRKEMNHSDRFYAEVLRVFPYYRRWDRWLKENGRAILARLPKNDD